MTTHEAPQLNTQDLLDWMVERPGRKLYPIAVLLLIAGVLGFIAGLSIDAQRAWTAFVWNWAFWSGISIGAAVLVAVVTTVGGHWLRPLRRFTEAMTAFLPVSFILMIVLFFGLGHVYPWIADPPAAKAAYLNRPFFIVRQSVGLAVLYGFALSLVYWSLRPDLGRLRSRVHGWRRGVWDRITRNWRGLDVEEQRAHENRERLGPALALIYAAIWTLFAWDWLMSIDPHWFSTLFGAWIFMTHFLAAIGMTAVLSCRFQAFRRFGDLVGRRALHDIGKMLFAFTVFWTYLFFAQYLVIWYGRLAEETHFIRLRLWEAYQPVATIVLLAVFLIPFLGLLGVRPKRKPLLLTGFAVMNLFGLWLFHFLIIAPGVYADRIVFGWIELAVAAGVAGAFALSVLAFLRTFPAIAIAAGLPPDPEAEKFAELTEPHHH